MILKGHIRQFFSPLGKKHFLSQENLKYEDFGAYALEVTTEIKNHADRKCLYLYFYCLDREFGFMHVKLQTWFPFMIQAYINGREYLARQLDSHSIEYNRCDNSFTYISDIEKAQELANKIESLKLCGRLDAIASRINPFLRRI